MHSPSRRSLHLFLAGALETLYAGAASRLPARFHRRPRPAPFVYLCEGRHVWWAVVVPADSYTGRVAYSNLLPSGAVIRSKKSWRFAAMRRDPSHPQTLVSPRFVKIVWLPPPPRVGRGRQRPFVPLRDFSLVA